MTNRKNTKRALFASVISMLLCVTMLVGSTFAWFTDNATTNVNTIEAGTLKVDIQDTQGKSLAGETLSFVDKDGNVLSNILWEPGATYKLPAVKIVNAGSLALQFKLFVNGVNGDGAKLADVLEVKIGEQSVGILSDLMTDTDGIAYGTLAAGGSTDSIAVSLHMMESAGNMYQGLKLDSISFRVYAAQYTSESDSFSNQYDKDAEYDMLPGDFGKTVKVTPENAATAFANYEDGTVFLLAEGTYSTLPGQLIGKSVALIADGEVKFTGNKEFENGHNGENSGSTLYIEGIDFSGMLTVRDTGSDVVIKDCSMNHILLYGSDKNATKFVIDGCTIDGTTHTTGTLYGIYGAGIADDTVTITNNTIKNVTKHAIGINGTCGEVVITGNVFDNFGTDGDNRSAFHTWGNDKYSNGTTPAVGDTLPDISTALAAAIKADNTFVNWKDTNAYASFGNVRFAD